VSRWRCERWGGVRGGRGGGVVGIGGEVVVDGVGGEVGGAWGEGRELGGRVCGG